MSNVERCGRGFTLVELLVVVTIIVILLALLLPAMGKAIYLSNLAACGGRQKAILSGVIQYAHDSKRWYPPHGLKDLKAQHQSDEAPNAFIAPMTLHETFDKHVNYDIRPPLKGYVPINPLLHCPFNEPVDLEVKPPNGIVQSSYMLLWGWFYNLPTRVEAGMFKLGDAWEWTEGSKVRRYTVLTGDIDVVYPPLLGMGDKGLNSSHPDIDGKVMFHQASEGDTYIGAQWWNSRWYGRGTRRGDLDLNFGYDDGSVRRLSNVPDWDPPYTSDLIDRVPLQYDGRRTGWDHDRFTVPR